MPKAIPCEHGVPSLNKCAVCRKAREKARKQTPEYKAREKARQQTPEWKAREKARQQTPENKARRHKRHGIKDPEMYKPLADLQGRRCAICKTPESALKKKLALDHNRDTGFSRGLLCDKHNRGLGFFEDNVDTLYQALGYLLDPPAEKLRGKATEGQLSVPAHHENDASGMIFDQTSLHQDSVSGT